MSTNPLTNLSRPAYLAAVAYMIMALVILLPFNVNSGIQPELRELSSGYVFTQRLFIVLLMLIPIGLSVYSLNCFVVGKCVTWSYINAILIIVWVLLFVIAAVLSSHVQSNVAEAFVNAHQEDVEEFGEDDEEEFEDGEEEDFEEHEN